MSNKPQLTPYYLKEDFPDPTLLAVKLALRCKEHSEVPNKHYFEKFIRYNHLATKQCKRKTYTSKADRILALRRKQYDKLFLDPSLRDSNSPKRAESPVQRVVQTAGARNPKLLKINRMYEEARRASLNFSLIGEARQRVKETVDQLSAKFCKK
mmetsp:Transcript_26861/g.48419  ORF Transcript_26861/g.48419 Transcript_26861/m.48419 type:complete len:154 (+) Transcript_26861:125-586(+)